jgi:hypothetical protein
MNPLGVIMKVESGFESHVMQSLAPRVKVVDHLYHYTTAASFLNMLDTNQLWLSHASFMNDPTEIDFGVSVILDILSRSIRCPTCVKMLKQQRLIHTEQALDVSTELAFVFSLTELDDHVAPWIEYADHGSGVCLEFNHHRVLQTLRPLIPSSKHMYFPVQYYAPHLAPSESNIPDFQRIVLDYYVDIEAYVLAENLSDDFQLQRSLYSMTKLLASFIKHEFHKEEKEWRFVLFAGRGTLAVEVVPAGLGVKMVYKLDFKPGRLVEIIDSVKVGPKHTSDNRIAAALEIAILKKQGKDYNLLHSKGIVR